MRSGLNERVVAHTWETQSFNPALLQQLNMRLVYRGMPSDAGGPDYQDALFAQKDKSLLRGDVEFHVASSDWYNHGHHTDVAYNNVQLHVVWHDDRRPTVRYDGVEIPVLELCQHVNTGEKNLGATPFPRGCAYACKHLAHEQILERLRFAALERFDERADRFEADAQSVGADQTLYAAMFEALGYASNRRPFALLADAVPYAWLMSLPVDDRGPALLDAAGFGPRQRVDLPGRIAPGEWRLSRLRPANHPIRRILAAVAILNTLEPSIERAACERVLNITRPTSLIEMFHISNEAGNLLGRGRASEICVSVVLPFVASRPGMREKAVDLFVRFPSPPANRWTRGMRDMLTLADHPLNRQSAPFHQGMHHVYHRFCRRQRRDVCVLCRPSR